MSMKKLTDTWDKVLSEYRYSKWNLCGPSEPVMPWISPSTPFCLARTLKNIGTTIHLEPGELLTSALESPGGEIPAEKYAHYDHLIYVRRGIIGQTATPTSGAGSKLHSLSITPAGRILGGGLDFYFCHPFRSTRYALTKSEILVCNKEVLKQILDNDDALQQTLQQYFELCYLSNSITLEAISSLGVTERIKLYLLSWAVYWGVLITDSNETQWVRIPLPLLREEFSRLISSSRASVDKTITTWKKEGILYTEAPYMYFQSSLVVDMMNWLCVFDEFRSTYRNNLTLEDIMPESSIA